MAGPELTEEDIMANDVDPIDALREIRQSEGVDSEDLPQRTDIPSDEVLDQDPPTQEQDAADEEEAVDEGTTAEDAETVGAQDSGDEPAADEDDTTEEGEKAATEAAEEFAGKKFRANGQDFEFTQDEINEQFETVFGKAMDYTQKMQKIAPFRKMISALESEGISHDQLNVAIDAMKGDKGAIKKLLEQNKIDAYDLTADEENATAYVPSNYGKNETTLAIEEITSKLSGDEEFKITTNVIDEQWDGASRQAIAANPQMIEGLHNDIVSGLYDQVAPIAMKMKVLDGNSKSDVEYYILAGNKFAQEHQANAKAKESQDKVNELNADAQGADSKFDKASSEASRKRAAASTGARADRKGVIDYLDDNDDDFEAWYKQIHANS
jgi:hypothetical protein